MKLSRTIADLAGSEDIQSPHLAEALDKIQSEQPDLVLLDLAMPVMDGFTVLDRVKADSMLRDIPIIIISAEHDSKSVVRGIKQGAEDYLTKPVNAELLVKKLKEYLG